MSRHHRVADIKHIKQHENYGNNYKNHKISKWCPYDKSNENQQNNYHHTCKCCPHDNININININNVIGGSGNTGLGSGNNTAEFGLIVGACVNIPTGTIIPMISDITSNTPPYYNTIGISVDDFATYTLPFGDYTVSLDITAFNQPSGNLLFNIEQGSNNNFNVIQQNIPANSGISYPVTSSPGNNQIRIRNVGPTFTSGLCDPNLPAGYAAVTFTQAISG